MFNLRSLFITALLVATPAAMLPEAPEATPMPAEPTPTTLVDERREDIEAILAAMQRADMQQYENREKRRQQAQKVIESRLEKKMNYSPVESSPVESSRMEFDHCVLVDLYHNTPIRATAKEIEACASNAKHRYGQLMEAAADVRHREQEEIAKRAAENTVTPPATTEPTISPTAPAN